jgi:uncharacterized protein
MKKSKPVDAKDAQARGLAVVTGASTGIGLELAREFARNGYDVVAIAENAELMSAAKELESEGATITPVRVDLATQEGVEQAWSRVKQLGRPVDALVLNAGVGVSGEFAKGTELEPHLHMIRLNVISTVHLAKLALAEMEERGQGRVLLTSSVAATMPAPWLSTYAASKAFVQSFAEGIREELKDKGITVTSLMPGATDTQFFKRAKMQDTPVGKGKKDDPAKVARQGFQALMAGKDAVVAGSVKNKVQVAATRVMPEKLRAKLHGKQTRPANPKKRGQTTASRKRAAA